MTVSNQIYCLCILTLKWLVRIGIIIVCTHIDNVTGKTTLVHMRSIQFKSHARVAQSWVVYVVFLYCLLSFSYFFLPSVSLRLVSLNTNIVFFSFTSVYIISRKQYFEIFFCVANFLLQVKVNVWWHII